MISRLAAHRTLADAPRAELEWLAAHGYVRSIAAGAVANAKGVQLNFAFIVLTGHIVIRGDGGAGAHKIFEWHGGDVGGLLPYSRGARPPHDAIAEEDTELFQIPSEHFPELIIKCPTVTTKMVHLMLDRARVFTSSDLRDEKLVSLGKLAAGLAHELNNPASAATRAAKLLGEAQQVADEAARHLGAARLSATQLAAVDELRDNCLSREPGHLLSGLERLDREDAIAAWLTVHGIGDESAGPLAETAVSITSLDALASAVDGPGLDAAIRWLAAACAVRSLAYAVETSATRVSEMVNAVKGFTYMDQALNAEAIDIRRGIADAITMLGGKVRAKAAEVVVDYAPDLPRARAVGAELNQVWMNLIDNALDAIGPKGTVRIVARGEQHRVVVEVCDNGVGIAPEVLWRIFDPFYTTKGVGKGTGLGLDIVRRTLQRQEGGIEAESSLGRTVFRVWLPAADAAIGQHTPMPPKRASAIVGPHSD
jgi:signal transduction histidine kinase